MAKNLYTLEAFENLLESAQEAGYDCIQLNEGTLLCGDWVLYKRDGLNSYVCQETYLNEWSSAYDIKVYTPSKRLPDKWLKAANLQRIPALTMAQMLGRALIPQ